MNLQEESNQHFLQQLFDANVRCILVGGLAVNYYGYSRSTGDIDLWLKDTQENRVNFVEALTKIGIVGAEAFITAPLLAGFTEVLLDSGIYIDVMSEMQFFTKENFDECYNQSVIWEPFDGVKLRVLHLNALISEKEQSSRPKDIEDARVLKELRTQANLSPR